MLRITKVIQNYDDLMNEVDANQGITTVRMGELRQCQGKNRIGKNINSGISRELATRGLNHQPKNLPNRQERLVRIFKNMGPIASLITAVRVVKPQHDAAIRKAAGVDISST